MNSELRKKSAECGETSKQGNGEKGTGKREDAIVRKRNGQTKPPSAQREGRKEITNDELRITKGAMEMRNVDFGLRSVGGMRNGERITNPEPWITNHVNAQ